MTNPFDVIREKLAWRGPNGKTLGNICLERAEAEKLLELVEDERRTMRNMVQMLGKYAKERSEVVTMHDDLEKALTGILGPQPTPMYDDHEKALIREHLHNVASGILDPQPLVEIIHCARCGEEIHPGDPFKMTYDIPGEKFHRLCAPCAIFTANQDT